MEHLGLGEVCPACHAPLTRRTLGGWRAGKRVVCTPCGWRGSWRDGTILERSRLSASQFLLLGVLVQFSADNRHIADFLGVDPDTVKTWRHKLKGLGQ